MVFHQGFDAVVCYYMMGRKICRVAIFYGDFNLICFTGILLAKLVILVLKKQMVNGTTLRITALCELMLPSFKRNKQLLQ